MTARPASNNYLLGSTDEELERLGFQHRVWSEQAFSLWEIAGFGRGQSLLDLGCGPGFATLDLAHLVGPQGRVIAFDASQEYLDYLTRQARAQGLENIETIQGDIHDIELPAASLDGVYARWLFCFATDPEAVLKRLARAMGPGAALAVTDYFNYRAFTFAPRSSILDQVVSAVETAWKQYGGDLAIQGRMPGMMLEAGLRIGHLRQWSRIARPGSALWNWPAMFFRSFLPSLVEMDLVSAEDEKKFWEEWEQRSQDPAAFLCIPPMFDVVGTKPLVRPSHQRS
jgi:SAM-dependent methyltransferase